MKQALDSLIPNDAAACREVVERRVYTVTGQKASADEVDRMIETGESESIFQKAILEQGRGHVRTLATPLSPFLLQLLQAQIEGPGTAINDQLAEGGDRRLAGLPLANRIWDWMKRWIQKCGEEVLVDAARGAVMYKSDVYQLFTVQ